jgi:hypothetical protein
MLLKIVSQPRHISHAAYIEQGSVARVGGIIHADGVKYLSPGRSAGIPARLNAQRESCQWPDLRVFSSASADG